MKNSPDSENSVSHGLEAAAKSAGPLEPFIPVPSEQQQHTSALRQKLWKENTLCFDSLPNNSSMCVSFRTSDPGYQLSNAVCRSLLCDRIGDEVDVSSDKFGST